MVIFDMPEMSEPRDVTTILKEGAWHFKKGVRRDNMGDGQMGVAVYGDKRYYVLMMRMGGNPRPVPGGAFWFKPYDGNPYEGWMQTGQEPGTTPHHIQAIPGTAPASHHNIDTHFAFASPLTGIGNPLTGVKTWASGVKPGNRPNPQRGQYFSIQRSTNVVLSSMPEDWTQFLPKEELLFVPDHEIPFETPRLYGNREWWGGSAESAGVFDPWAGEAVAFVTSKTQEGPDWTGTRFRARIGRHVAPMANFDVDPQFVRDPHGEPVFDPTKHGGKLGEWGTHYTILQQSVAIWPDGGYHLVAHGKTPLKAWSTGKPKGGQMNKTDAFGHWWSDDRGRTWHPDSRNPLFDKAHFGIDETLNIANQMNSPHTWYDPWAKKLYFTCWINRTGEQNKLGTRLVLMEAEWRP
jgi:hypothetical protein